MPCSFKSQVKEPITKGAAGTAGVEDVLVLSPSIVYPVLMDAMDHIPKQFISLKRFLPCIPLFAAFNVLGILPI